MQDRLIRWAKSRRGILTGLLALSVVIGQVQSGINPFTAILGLLFLVPILAVLVFVLSILWEAKTVPSTPRFARSQPPSSSRQLREDGNAKVFADHGGFLFAKRYFFVGTGCPPVRLKADIVKVAHQESKIQPVLVATTDARRFWWYQDRFAWENQGLVARDVMALLHERDRRHGRQLTHAHTMLDVEQGLAVAPPRQRQPIPRDVRQAVFARDGGRCVECASDFDIQYDHVIPWSMGGADSIENLQLLCSSCNRSKAATI